MSMPVRTLRAVRSMPQMRSLQSSTKVATPSHLLSSIQSQYSALTVNALKHECKTRGLRVAGRKADLIDRIVAYEAAQQFSTSSKASATARDLKKPPAPPAAPAPPVSQRPKTSATQTFSTAAAAEAKNDSSSIDFFHMPKEVLADEPAEELHSRMVVPPDASYKAAEHSPRTVEPRVPDESGSAAVYDASGSNVISTITENDGDPKAHNEEDSELASGGVSDRDRKILWGLAASVAAWWASGSLFKSRKKKD